MNFLLQKLIGENPYRTLGVYVGDSIAKESNHRSRISAYAKVGQCATFVLKGDDVLHPLVRNEAMAEKAVNALSLPSDRLKHALFWYADEKFEWASVLNGAIDSLLSGNFADAMAYYEHLIQDDALRTGFIETVTAGVFMPGKDYVENALAETILDHIQNTDIIIKNYSPESRNLNRIFFNKEVKCKLDVELLPGSNRADDFYKRIEALKTTIGEVMPYMDYAAAVLGKSDPVYLDYAEEVAVMLYKGGGGIISEIAIWTAKVKSFLAIKICLSTMNDLHQFVTDSVMKLGLTQQSFRIMHHTVENFNRRYDDGLERIKVCLKKAKRPMLIRRFGLAVLWLLWIVIGILALDKL